ncbi:MAG: VCBS repeat-containing protein, partial [Bacteroidota bacterium]|nr:VCBS repeat-containing protein [Bacteroidota bacterium]
MKEIFAVLLFTSPFIFLSCKEKPVSQFEENHKEAGINFNNQLTYTETLNPYTYRNFYNGGGVALGDINNDGLLDIYFTGNIVPNKLFLNKGNFKFEDITAKAGVACEGVWSTGVTFVDINGDGLLDIYVCKSGSPEGERRHNELFINNGDLTFTEKAKEYGLDNVGLSTHAAFFDFDNDGDLDCYLLTNSIKSVGNYDLVKNQREIPDAFGGGNKFFKNDNGKFIDYTAEAGIYHSDIGFGLGITLGDFNDDGWTDIFVSNDFFEKDYLYINNKNGGFDELLEQYFQSISMGSMGADLADLDNNGKPDLMVTEMLPDSLNRKKTKAAYESWDKYQASLKSGYYHQFPRNVLQKNLGNQSFVELGRMAGVSATEWSWSALLFDMDNDGLRDIFISNGIFKDLLDRDYLNYTATDENIKEMINNKDEVIKNLIDKMPSEAVSNFTYKNIGGFVFEDHGKQWNLDQKTFSNGAAYGDLDNDGDLDLVINNVNMPAYIYKNNTDTFTNRSLRVKLIANGKNSFQIGAKVVAWTEGKQYFSENFVTRGFQSSVDPTIHIGLGSHQIIDSLLIYWSEGGITVLNQIKTNQTLEIQKEKILVIDKMPPVKDQKNIPFKKFEMSQPFEHQQHDLVDFDRDRLLPWMYSNEAPKISIGDIDGNNAPEIFIGGAKNQAGQLHKVDKHSFNPIPNLQFEKDKASEDVNSIFFDADNDGDLDLYVASGGRGYPKSSSLLMDRLYINDGKGNFVLSTNPLPFKEFFSSSVVTAGDFDNDGDIDLFVGERFHPFFYGIGGSGYILENDGKGKFTNVTAAVLPSLKDIGMVTDAKWIDINNDGLLDLVVVGDWMPIKIFINENGKLTDQSKAYGLENTRGWWNTIEIGDINRNGNLDFIVGNHGNNSFFKPGDRMYVHDFDGNGSIEQIFCTKVNGKYFPVIDKDELISQLPGLKKKLLYYTNYSRMSIDEIFGAEVLEKAKVYEVDMLESTMFLSSGNNFKPSPLPK